MAVAVLAGTLVAQNPSAVLNLAATTAGVAGAPDAVRIEILRWSTDDERDRLLAAWSLKAAPSGPAATKGKAAAKGKGAAKAPEAAAALTPSTALALALQEVTTVGYLWSSELAGYALRYAGKFDGADGSQRIILITQRRLGAVNQLWTPAAGTPNGDEFSVIELRLNAKGEGEGKASLTGAVSADAAAKIVSIANYSALPVVLRDVRKQTHP
jgi:hypothetical protein